jgi:aminopeptidase N
LRSWITSLFAAPLHALGWTAPPDEDDRRRLRRAALLRLVGSIAEAPDVVAEASARLVAYLADRSSLEPNLADAVVSISARQGTEALYERYRELTASAPTPQERRRFLLNLASFRAPSLVERTLQATLGSEVPTQDVAFVYMRLFANPGGRDAAWRFFARNWKRLRARIPPLMVSRLVESTPALRDARYARVVAKFFHLHPIPEATRSLKQALEVFRLNAELRKRIVPGIARWSRRRDPV